MTSKTLYMKDSTRAIGQCATILRKGGVVAIPTETVYGLAADAASEYAVKRIFNAKGRPSFNPLIVHVDSIDMLEEFAFLNEQAEVLASHFWPGPLTLVLPLKVGAPVAPAVTAGLRTVAVRFPAHPAARSLIGALGGALAAPSANLSGKASPTTAFHVAEALDGRIDAVLDGGKCLVGLESTILGFEAGIPSVLRHGGIAVDEIAAVLKQENIIDAPLADSTERVIRPKAPGQLNSHYAPDALVRLNVCDPVDGEVWVGFGCKCVGAPLNLSLSGNLTEAAACLFQILREADSRAGPDGRIAFAPIPCQGIGVAINDRLWRAAAPRG